MNAYAEPNRHGKSCNLAHMINLAQAKDKKQPNDCCTPFNNVQRLESWNAGMLEVAIFELLPPRGLEDLINVLPAVFVRRLEIVKLFVKTRYIRFELCRLGC